MSDEQQVITIKTYYDRTLTVDVDGEPVEIPICVQRFSSAQLLDFTQRFKRVEDPPAQRLIYRKPDTDEWHQTPVTVRGTSFHVFTVSDEEIRRRRLVEMSEEERQRYEAQAADDDRYTSEFCADVITKYVWVKKRVRVVLDLEGGQPVEISTGESIARAFAGNLHVMRELVRAIKDENTLGAADKQRARRAVMKTDAPAPAEPQLDQQPT